MLIASTVTNRSSLTTKTNSDYIVYVDESGDHCLTSIDPVYPVFVLSFCVFQKTEYTKNLTPEVRKLKFETFGHDIVVLHESDIRRKKGAFSKLSKELRESFLEKLTNIMTYASFQLIAVVIDKRKLKENHEYPGHPYHIALEFGLERIYQFLKGIAQDGVVTHIVCEARGKKEDLELNFEFERICGGKNLFNCHFPFELVIADKKTNSEGLQLADLTARPIGLTSLRPDQPNRAAEALEDKFYRDQSGNKFGVGLKVFP